MIQPTDKSSSQPLLSVVATARNDNHGGNLIGRMQIFVNGVLEQCERHGIDAELILVDWNPPDDKPHLCDALAWPSRPGRCKVRVIEVPPEVHVKMQHSTLPLFQMIAKNVGIRRARGRFVLATNIDILFSDAVFQFMKSEQLRPGYMYRVNRFDVLENVPPDCSLDEQLKFCEQNIIRKHFFEGSFDCRTRKWSSWRENVQTRRGRFWNVLRRSNHRVKLTYRTAVNNVLNRVRYTRNHSRQFVRTQYNNVRNYSGHYYRLTRSQVRNAQNYSGHYYRLGRGKVREVVNRCGHVWRVNKSHVRNYSAHYYRLTKGQVRTIYYRCGHNYRTCRNLARNHVRHLYSTKVKRTVQSAKRRGYALQRWVHPTKGPRHWQFWAYLLLIPLRIVLLVLSLAYDILRAGLRQIGRVAMWLLAASGVQNAVDRFLTNATINSFKIRWVHFRERTRLKYRVTAMTFRDRLPRWIDNSSLLPPRSNNASRDARIRKLQQEIDRLKKVDVSRAAAHLTQFQLRQRDRVRRVRAVQRRKLLLFERQRKRQQQQARERVRSRAQSWKIERRRQDEWRRWSKAKLQELAILDRKLQQERARLQQETQPPMTVASTPASEVPLDLSQESQTETAGVVLAQQQSEPSQSLECATETSVAVCEQETTFPSEFPRNGHHSDSMNGDTSPAKSTDEGWYVSQTTESRQNGAASVAQDDSAEQHPSQEPAWKISQQRKEKVKLQWPYLHTNGCGDFTMLAYEDWAALEGYAEFEMYSMHIDSLFLIAGAHHGLKQFVLGNRAPIYHIEHGVGSGWTPEGEAVLKQRLRAAKIPSLSHDEFMDYDLIMARNGKAEMFNGPNWGLADIDLPEIEIK